MDFVKLTTFKNHISLIFAICVCDGVFLGLCQTNAYCFLYTYEEKNLDKRAEKPFVYNSGEKIISLNFFVKKKKRNNRMGMKKILPRGFFNVVFKLSLSYYYTCILAAVVQNYAVRYSFNRHKYNIITYIIYDGIRTSGTRESEMCLW